MPLAITVEDVECERREDDPTTRVDVLSQRESAEGRGEQPPRDESVEEEEEEEERRAVPAEEESRPVRAKLHDLVRCPHCAREMREKTLRYSHSKVCPRPEKAPPRAGRFATRLPQYSCPPPTSGGGPARTGRTDI